MEQVVLVNVICAQDSGRRELIQTLRSLRSAVESLAIIVQDNKGRVLGLHNGNNAVSGGRTSWAGIPDVCTRTGGGNSTKDNITD